MPLAGADPAAADEIFHRGNVHKNLGLGDPGFQAARRSPRETPGQGKCSKPVGDQARCPPRDVRESMTRDFLAGERFGRCSAGIVEAAKLARDREAMSGFIMAGEVGGGSEDGLVPAGRSWGGRGSSSANRKIGRGRIVSLSRNCWSPNEKGRGDVDLPSHRGRRQVAGGIDDDPDLRSSAARAASYCFRMSSTLIWAIVPWSLRT